MQTVYKYVLPINDEVEIQMPLDAQILSCDNQNNCPCLWALVDADKPTEKRRFRIAGTGHPITEFDLKFIGTVLLFGGSLVFHIFEI